MLKTIKFAVKQRVDFRKREAIRQERMKMIDVYCARRDDILLWSGPTLTPEEAEELAFLNKQINNAASFIYS
jgi:hypothetical protein